MSDVNKVMLIGRLTRDPETRETNSGTVVCEFSIACNRTHTHGKGEKKEDTTYVEVVSWGSQAKSCSENLKKSSKVHVEGRLNQDKWERDGVKRSKTNVVAEKVTFL